jgi:transcription initiation factor IIF auxiliary subunit
MRWPQYGHTKAYCNRPFVCVKCGGTHATSSCKKTKDTPAKCALCNGPHPANYKGCEFYHRLAKGPNNVNNRLNIHHNTYFTTSNPTSTNNNSTIPTNRNQIPAHIQPNTSYANVVRGNANQEPRIEENSTMLTKILEEFKAMFQQLVHQNSMVLNMLTTLISKIR